MKKHYQADSAIDGCSCGISRLWELCLANASIEFSGSLCLAKGSRVILFLFSLR